MLLMSLLYTPNFYMYLQYYWEKWGKFGECLQISQEEKCIDAQIQKIHLNFFKFTGLTSWPVPHNK